MYNRFLGAQPCCGDDIESWIGEPVNPKGFDLRVGWLPGGEEEGPETAEVTTKMRVDLVAKMIQSLAGFFFLN